MNNRMTLTNKAVRRKAVEYLQILRSDIERMERTHLDFAVRYCTVRFDQAKKAQIKRLKQAVDDLEAYVLQKGQ